MQIDYPFHIDARGRSALAAPEDHLNDLIEQVLFTIPGERVNRPDFGSGLMQLVFTPNSSEIAATVQYLVQSNLQHWLGSLIVVESVQAENDDSTLRITIQYQVRRSGQRQQAQFVRSV